MGSGGRDVRKRDGRKKGENGRDASCGRRDRLELRAWMKGDNVGMEVGAARRIGGARIAPPLLGEENGEWGCRQWWMEISWD